MIKKKKNTCRHTKSTVLDGGSECHASQSFLQSGTMMGKGWEHVFVHGGSIILAFIIQLITMVFSALSKDCEPDGE